MSEIWIPGQSKPKAIHSEKINACVLVHHETKRILTFCFKDAFAENFQALGYELIEITSAREYDMWAQKIRIQARAENEAQEYADLVREAPVRERLRNELKERVRNAPNPVSKMAADSALKCLDHMEQRKKRTFETFMLNEAVEASKGTAGEELVRKIIENK